jgi:hypothetical protein
LTLYEPHDIDYHDPQFGLVREAFAAKATLLREAVMSSAARQPRLFCTKCGAPSGIEARFCNSCGSSLTPQTVKPDTVQSVSAKNWALPFPQLEGEKVQFGPFPGTVTWEHFDYNDQRYEKPTLPRPFPARILVTDQRLVLLDHRNNLLGGEIVLKHLPRIAIDDRGGEHKVYSRHAYPMSGGRVPLSPFWVFKPTANEGLYNEFLRDPKGYSKVGGAWWVDGYRQWSWIDQVLALGDRELRFRLLAVQVFSAWGPGRQLPTNHPEGWISICFDPPVSAQVLLQRINRQNPEDPFRPEFLASIPYRPETPGFRAYTNIFWIAAAEVIPMGILWGAGAPPWLFLLVGVGVAWGALYLLKRFRRWIEKKLANAPSQT